MVAMVICVLLRASARWAGEYLLGIYICRDTSGDANVFLFLGPFCIGFLDPWVFP